MKMFFYNMANKVKWLWLPAICSFFLFSCVNELDEGNGTSSKKEIAFKASNITAAVTRSAEETSAKDSTENGRKFLFLGLIGNDSLFLSVREEANLCNFSDSNKTRSSSVPDEFQITGFKDNETVPYVDLVISSSDSWDTYTPTLYWPYSYSAIHFFASTPNPSNSLFSTTYPNKNTAVFTYTVPESGQDNDAIMQQDIIYAVAPDNSEDDSNDAVVLSFRHILSGIQFNIPTTIGDATVADAKIQLGNIITTRQCTVTESGASWDNPNPSSQPERGTYSQSINNGETTFPNGESFKLIPQPLTGSGAQYTISFKVGEVDHSYSGDLEELTEEWESGKRYIFTITKRDEVKLDVTASVAQVNSQPVLQGVRILNTGFSRSYLRVAVVGYWYILAPLDNSGSSEEVESIISAWEINEDDATIGVLLKDQNWNTYWKLGDDGFFYYKDPVDPGTATAVPLFDSYTLKALGVSNSKLKVHIAVQAINEELAAEYWPELTAGN